MGVLIWLVTSCLILVSFSAPANSVECDRCVYQSKVTFFSKPAVVPNGSCGYGNQATRLKGGRFAGATSVIYNNGVACGECFQVRCTDKRKCTDGGTTVIVTDLNKDDRTGFVLSKTAFMDMANNKASRSDLLKHGVVDVEYQRVPCNYRNNNMSIQVKGISNRTYNYLAIQLLFQGGQTDFVSIELARSISDNWVPVNRNYGAVWDANNVPQKGNLRFKFKVKRRDGGNKDYTTKPVIPANWTIGKVYDSGIQITDIAPEYSCKSCSDVWQ